jgi:hypothetical protein
MKSRDCLYGMHALDYPYLPWMSYKATKGLIVTPEIDCDQTAMVLPLVTSAVFLITD